MNKECVIETKRLSKIARMQYEQGIISQSEYNEIILLLLSKLEKNIITESHRNILNPALQLELKSINLFNLINFVFEMN